MMSEIKVSELIEAEEMNKEDVLMIVQNEANKKIVVENFIKFIKTEILQTTFQIRKHICNTR